MTTEQQKKLTARLRRVAGQVRALEGEIGRAETETVTNQILAVIAAAKGILRLYLESQLLSESEISVADRRLLAKLLNRVD